jgi:hypothetical protein
MCTALSGAVDGEVAVPVTEADLRLPSPVAGTGRGEGVGGVAVVPGGFAEDPAAMAVAVLG